MFEDLSDSSVYKDLASFDVGFQCIYCPLLVYQSLFKYLAIVLNGLYKSIICFSVFFCLFMLFLVMWFLCALYFVIVVVL